MKTTTITNGSCQVVITEGSKVSARLYVDNGNVATLQTWTGKTVAGAKTWAKKVLAP